MKNKNFGKKTVWRYGGQAFRQAGSFPKNLAWIHAEVFEKSELTDDGRTTDERRMDGQRTHAPRQ